MIIKAAEPVIKSNQRMSVLKILPLITSLFVVGCKTNPQQITLKSCDSRNTLKENIKKISKNNFSTIDHWIKINKVPALSVLVSQKGQLIYKYYQSEEDKDISRNTMSITKSVVSAMVGIAIDNKLIKSVDSSIVSYLPDDVKKSDVSQLKSITIKNVMAMSALDAKTWPKNTKEIIKRANDFHESENRLSFALQQKVVASPGNDFEYTDITPIFISAILQNVTGKSLFDFANETLFKPMDFKNPGWLFRDHAGYDIASYGLELRPIDIHKFGILYLNDGCWEGKQLVPRQWVQQSFVPYIKSHPDLKDHDYGWFWWKHEFKPGWFAYLAKGWHGQRLAIFPDKNIVITITADLTDTTEERDVKNLFDLLLVELDKL